MAGRAVLCPNRQKNAGKAILYCNPVQAGPAFYIFFWKGRNDAQPLNYKHSACNGYKTAVYDQKTRTFLIA